MVPVSVGFPPILAPSARVLILGSLPGVISLERSEYYAQPRNVFWRIMGDLFGFPPALPYAARKDALLSHGVALWDVCACAHRPGSLDSAINLDSVKANDFALLFSNCAGIGLICFNGAKASALYAKRVIPSLNLEQRKIPSRILPSTSPAHASLRYEAKRSAWEILCIR